VIPGAQKPITIFSIKENVVVEARSLQNARGRLTAGKFMIEGEEQILWALENQCRFQSVFIHDKQQFHPLIEKLKQKNIAIFFASDGILKKISDTAYLVPFIGIVEIQKTAFPKEELVVVLDGVQDFGNIGTIVRTAEAFGIREFISTKEDFDWFYRKAIDASRGKILSSHLNRCASGKEAVLKLKAQGYQIAVTTLRDSQLQSFAEVEGRPIAIVFGNETSGVSSEVEEAADLRIQIPMSGSVESLNVGVAAGISLYELKIKWVLAMLTKKIQESLGRDLYCASRWLRLVFDLKLKEGTPLNADQAILMMILKCDQVSTPAKLGTDAGIAKDADAQALIQSLIDQRFISETNGKLVLLEKGEEVLAKIWSIHEFTERLAFEGVSDQEKEIFLKVLRQMLSTCEKITPFT
jgi:TrmH family RNA methyltransferase